MICRVCNKPIEQGQKTMNLDYETATGRKTSPPVNSPNYDDRYGFLVHVACFHKKTAAYEKRHKNGK